MAITTTWNVVQMNCYPNVDGEADVVFTVHWTLTAEQFVGGEPLTSSLYGSVGVTLDAEAPFTPYADLTQDQVIGWVKDALGAEQVAEYEAGVESMIEAQINPPVVTPPLPWAVTLPAPVEEVPAE